MANEIYPVKLVKGAEPIAELPTEFSRDLYNAFIGPANGTESWLAIGTPRELRQLISEGILPANCWFTLEAVEA